MGNFYSPTGELEDHDEKPEGYYTEQEWNDIQQTSPGIEYKFMYGAWKKDRFSKKEFMVLCGIDKILAVNNLIGMGNTIVQTVKDLLFAADYISLNDPMTGQMLNMLATEGGGNILTTNDILRILAGKYPGEVPV